MNYPMDHHYYIQLKNASGSIILHISLKKDGHFYHLLTIIFNDFSKEVFG